MSLFIPVMRAQTITFTQSDKTVIYPAVYFIQGDINRDGYPDFLFGLLDSTNIYTYISDGKGDYIDWTIPTQYCPSAPLGLGDFQRNDKQDLLVSSVASAQCATYNPSFADYVNNGSGIFNLYKEFPANAGVAAVLADFNGDRKLDAVVLDGNLELYYGDGWGSFFGPYKIATLTGTAASFVSQYNLIAGDFDGNGCPDVAWTEYEASGTRGFNSQLKIAYGDCHGNFSVVTQLNVVGEIDNIKTADLNRDGISDIVSTLDANGQGVTNPTLQILYGQKNRTLTAKLIADPSLSGPIQAADLSGDGYPDIAYITNSSAGTGIKILEGDAGQTFTASSTYAISGTHTPVQLASGDYNRDGKTDLAMLTSNGASGGLDFIQLYNTSAYAGGVCVPPATPGIVACSPGFTSGTAVNVLADANNTNPTVYMELWVDGVKRMGYGSTHELRGTLTLTPGSHQFAIFSADAAGLENSLVYNVKVQ
jgi:hypothetical protein